MAHELRETVLEGHDALELHAVEREIALTLVPGAGMVGASLTQGGRELLHRGDGLAGWTERGATFGIPLLHPWANRLGSAGYCAGGQQVTLHDGATGLRFDPQGLPMHGLLAGSADWVLEPAADATAPRSSARARFDFSEPELLESFPFPHRLKLDYQLTGGRLTLTTVVTATADQAVPIAFGFHPYLQLPGTARSDWEVELPSLRHLAVDDRGIPTGTTQAEPARRFRLGETTFDDGYDGLPDRAEFAVSGGGRRLSVRFDQGYAAVQIFAPSSDPVICFEPIAAPVNALVSGDGLRLAQPGESFTAGFSIAVAAG